MATRAADVTVAEAAARALAKVTQVMPARLRRRAEAVAAMTEPASWSSARAGQAAARQSRCPRQHRTRLP